MTQPPTLSYAPPPRSPKRKLARASFICGCVSLPMLGSMLCPFIPFVGCLGACYMPIALGTSIAAIVCGILALYKAAKPGSLDFDRSNRRLAILGIIFGALPWAILLIFILIALIVEGFPSISPPTISSTAPAPLSTTAPALPTTSTAPAP